MAAHQTETRSGPANTAKNFAFSVNVNARKYLAKLIKSATLEMLWTLNILKMIV